MGGCMLLLAARARPGLFRSLVLLCPADGGSLLAGLDELESDPESAPGGPPGREYSGRFDGSALRPFLRDLDLIEAAAGLPRVLLAHARDDDAVPFAHSERLAAVFAAPFEFIALGEGGHHGPGRSPYVARATIDWVLTHGGDRRSGCEQRQHAGDDATHEQRDPDRAGADDRGAPPAQLTPEHRDRRHAGYVERVDDRVRDDL
jgi:hypothetical protein